MVHENSMKLNTNKSHLLIFGENNIDVSVHISSTVITESVEEKLLVPTLDKNLENHVKTV